MKIGPKLTFFRSKSEQNRLIKVRGSWDTHLRALCTLPRQCGSVRVVVSRCWGLHDIGRASEPESGKKSTDICTGKLKLGLQALLSAPASGKNVIWLGEYSKYGVHWRVHYLPLIISPLSSRRLCKR
jgi:hypothetical protein